MHFTTKNVNTAFEQLVKLFNGDKYAVSDHPGPKIVKRPSRNGPVLMIDEPVMVTYERPLERVLFNTARDANPFLHLYEALWMLAGRNDVAPLAYYAKQFEQYSDDGRTLNGAYGYRWRHAKGELINGPSEKHGIEADWENVDQLHILIDHLKADPNSRRAVLQMWDVENDLLKIGLFDCNMNGSKITIIPPSKDVCCNTAVYFSIREEIDMVDSGGFTPDMRPIDIPVKTKFLDITVTNRSNDMVWGMLGGDFTTFSFLQEYMAARIGVEVGKYTQMTNNLHVYENNWKPNEWLVAADGFDYGNFNVSSNTLPEEMKAKYWGSGMWHMPLVGDPVAFEKELPKVVDKDWSEPPKPGEWVEPFFVTVVEPMFRAYYMHKCRDYDASKFWLAKIEDTAWSIATTNWITKRRDKHAK